MVVVDCSVYESMSTIRPAKSSNASLSLRCQPCIQSKTFLTPKNWKLSFLHKDDLSRSTPPPELKIKEGRSDAEQTDEDKSEDKNYIQTLMTG